MLMEMLYEQARLNSDQVALVYKEERITFTDLIERIERLATGLAGRGIGPGDAVGLALYDEPRFVVGFHAIAALGAIVVPVNPAFKGAEIEHFFRSSKVAAVISDERAAGVCGQVAAKLHADIELFTTGAAHDGAQTFNALIEEGATQRLVPRGPEEVLVYQFSSGSTGRPKRVPRTQGQCAAEADMYRSLGLASDDRIFSAIPLFHTWGMGACLFAQASTGATLIQLDDPHPFLLQRHRALKLISSERATFFPGVPFNYRLLAETPNEADLSSLRLCFSAGTALPHATFEAFRNRFGISVRQLYGSTETGMIAANLCDDPVASFASVGRGVAGVDIAIVDDSGRPLASHATGEVRVTSPAASLGYADADSVSQGTFHDGSYLTGDLGHMDQSGLLFLEGRKKLLIEVGGYKVDPMEVEDVVSAHPAVGEAVVVGVPGVIEGEELVKAVVVPTAKCSERELISYCRTQLSNFKVPTEIEFRDEIPKSPLGKILRKYLL